MLIQDGQTILFIGDSITDCGRRDANAPYGNGYVDVFNDCIIARYPDRDITVINKGIGGNRIVDLESRWNDDVMRYKPDWLSIKIGINDLHSGFGEGPDAMTPDVFRKKYDGVLARTVATWKPEIVLISPYFISIDFDGDNQRSAVLARLPEYVGVVKDMSEKYGTRYIDTQALFQEQLKYRDADTFCAEPVHPNRRGHTVIAASVMDALSA